MKITLIGLGTKQGQLTRSAEQALSSARKIMARTSRGEAYMQLSGYDVEYLDEVYSRSRNFDTLNKNLASRVIAQSKITPVVYP